MLHFRNHKQASPRHLRCMSIRAQSWGIYYRGLVILLLLLFVCFFFLVPYLWHMEVPRLGVESELQLPTTPQA